MKVLHHRTALEARTALRRRGPRLARALLLGVAVVALAGGPALGVPEDGTASEASLHSTIATTTTETADPGTSTVVVQGSPSTVPGVSQIVSGLNQPLYVTHAGDDRLFVVEKRGTIRILEQQSGTWSVTGTFLDIRNRVNSSGNEQGLLGLAFHPNYATNGKFYVNFTNNAGNTIVAEYQRANANSADPSTQRNLLKINQPFTNHNGGWIGFHDRYLYIATGDGGSGGDPGNRAQNKQSWFGKILRISVNDPDGAGPKTYSVPRDNPFVGQAGRKEVWSYGLRNPWRVSFDQVTGKIWIADVGQEQYEEVNRHATGRGINFGWRQMEGRHCYVSNCNTNGKRLPIAEYRHNAATSPNNCSITVGSVARRSGAQLYGKYVFGDFCSGRIWAIGANHKSGAGFGKALYSGRRISSFGEGADGRIYLTDLANGGVYYVQGT